MLFIKFPLHRDLKSTKKFGIFSLLKGNWEVMEKNI